MSKEFFKVSSGLKDIIGNELITDKYVAIFELVKNSFDAGANRVDITFENIYTKNTKIVIQDNGKGMDYDDIISKWLFVAYSAKRDKTEDADYRNKIGNERFYAGAKGVGRFSCDRLGKELLLLSKKKVANSRIESIVVDWSKFEKNQKDEFVKIPIEHSTLNSTKYKLSHGTVLEISQTPFEEWDRNSLVVLKDKLSKLIRPDISKKDRSKNEFRIFLHVKEEEKKDFTEREKNVNKGKGHVYRNTVNGEIKNFIFEELDIKTTKIVSTINSDGSEITTSLIDRMNIIYTVRENNNFRLLKDLKIELYFLNRSAKVIFGKKVGVNPVQFGNVFVYKNGFRIYPYGEPEDDSLGFNERAMQGYNRYLGTRNLIGQIEIYGNNNDFRETTSRDGGLVKTSAYLQLINSANGYLFHTLKRLEKYVVDVTSWGVNSDENVENLNDEEVKRKLAKLITNISDDQEVKSFDFNRDLIKLVGYQEEKSAKRIISNFKRIAADSNNKDLLKDAARLEKTLGSAIKAKESAEKESLTKSIEKQKIEANLALEKQKNTYLSTSSRSLSEDAKGLVHNIKITSRAIVNDVDDLYHTILHKELSRAELLTGLSKIKFNAEKALKISKIITRANFNTERDAQAADVIQSISQYIGVYSEITDENRIKFTLHSPQKSFIRRISILNISLALDNLISNALKASAKNILIDMEITKGSTLRVVISDDGKGVPDKFSESPQQIFELGITTTDGSGIGLHSVKTALEGMAASIKFIGNGAVLKGASFEIIFR